MSGEKPFELPEQIKNSGHTLDVVDGAIIGFIAGGAAEGKRTLFGKVGAAGIGAVIGLVGVKLGHWIAEALFAPKNERNR